MNQITQTEPSLATRRPQGADYVVPAINIDQDAEGYTLEVEMPGVPRSGVEVTVEDGKLTLVGRRIRGDETAFIYRESSEADYRRTFDLDPTIDSSRVEAGIEQGLLTVRLPKAEAARPRRIAVN